MTLADLIDAFRDESFDNNRVKYFWSNATLTRFANEAENEAGRRGSLLVSSSGPTCTYGVSAGQDVVLLDRSVLKIRRARMASGGDMLASVTAAQMDLSAQSWELETGTPIALVTDYQSGAVRLYPVPTSDDTLITTVSRLPLRQMEADDDEPEIRAEAHPALVQWMLYRAYSRQDAETFDPKKASRALLEFEREFGGKASMRNEQWVRDSHAVGADPIA